MPSFDVFRANGTRPGQPLVAWFKAIRDKIPGAPFALDAGRTVIGREGFLASLDREVAKGPDAPHFDILPGDLETLRAVVERRGRPG